MLDYAALSALAAVVREGSFERAARVLHVTPSAVSQRVRALEERLGCALVQRTQPAQATEAGRRLCQHAEAVLRLEATLHESLPGLSRSAAGGEAEPPPRVPLPVAVNADSLATWAAPPLAAYGAEHPVLLQVAVDDQDHTAAWLQRGDVLAAVCGAARPPPGCNAEPLGAMRYVAAASPAFMQRHFGGADPAGRTWRVDARALARAPSLQFNAKDDLQARWARSLCGQAVDLPRHTLPSSRAFVVAAEAGLGWGLHPLALVQPALAAGRLVELVPGRVLDVALYWHHARAASRLLAPLAARVHAAARAALL